MAKAKRYTAEQLRDAEKMAATLANVPEEKRTLAHFVRFSIFYGIIDLFVKIMPQVRFLTPW